MNSHLCNFIVCHLDLPEIANSSIPSHKIIYRETEECNTNETQ